MSCCQVEVANMFEYISPPQRCSKYNQISSISHEILLFSPLRVILRSASDVSIHFLNA